MRVDKVCFVVGKPFSSANSSFEYKFMYLSSLFTAGTKYPSLDGSIFIKYLFSFSILFT